MKKQKKNPKTLVSKSGVIATNAEFMAKSKAVMEKRIAKSKPKTIAPKRKAPKKKPPKKNPAKQNPLTTAGRRPALPRATKTVAKKRKKFTTSSEESSESEGGL